MAVQVALGEAFAVVESKVKTFGFLHDPHKLRASLTLPVREKVAEVRMPVEKLKRRISRAAQDERVEEVAVFVPVNEDKLAELAIYLAKSKMSTKLMSYLQARVVESRETNAQDGSRKVIIDREALRYVNLNRLSVMLAKTHHDVEVDTSALRGKSRVRDTLLKQLRPFLGNEDLSRVHQRLKTQATLSVDEHLLPSFARRMVERYVIYRGPNCFHAALAFHGQEFPESPWVNVKEEQGYHRAMINYDELWRAIQSEFYEIDPAATAMEYGDMLVFFDVPSGATQPYFRWIRHTATYLFGPYTFSKGSKSPNTPYTVKTLSEEWDTWRKYSRNLGVKVFRRSQKHVRKSPPVDLKDWIY